MDSMAMNKAFFDPPAVPSHSYSGPETQSYEAYNPQPQSVSAAQARATWDRVDVPQTFGASDNGDLSSTGSSGYPVPPSSRRTEDADVPFGSQQPNWQPSSVYPNGHFAGFADSPVTELDKIATAVEKHGSASFDKNTRELKDPQDVIPANQELGDENGMRIKSGRQGQHTSPTKRAIVRRKPPSARAPGPWLMRSAVSGAVQQEDNHAFQQHDGHVNLQPAAPQKHNEDQQHQAYLFHYDFVDKVSPRDTAHLLLPFVIEWWGAHGSTDRQLGGARGPSRRRLSVVRWEN
ncbi:hypothetical protein B0H65DRAFT_551585 [Neurospora tetraspora]|uniref:Uncharacterized protein n=1 Tax=Neurospora tetraspora TaxID=94610 RepID=A0AAE0J8C6_9PEZI|nr:hypothetical protein B0H65DRAFT_551585 [Neurospora tetraspora]